MILRFALLIAVLLPASAIVAAAQQVPAVSTPASTQLDRIEGKLDELLRRLPPRLPDAPASTAAGSASGQASSPALPQLETESRVPGAAEYRPGALAVVRPAPARDAVLAVPADSVGGFVFADGSLRLDDLASRGLRYRGPVGVELQGWFKVREAGRYQVGVDFGSPRAGALYATLTCGVALWLEDRQVGQRAAELALSPGNNTGPLSLVLGAELQPGLYKLRFWIACGRPNAGQPIPVTADVLLKAPADMNLRGINADDVLHRAG